MFIFFTAANVLTFFNPPNKLSFFKKNYSTFFLTNE
jgi:hypothetical protein